MKRKITKSYIVVYNDDNYIIAKGCIGNTINTPHTVVEFGTEEEMLLYIEENRLKELEE